MRSAFVAVLLAAGTCCACSTTNTATSTSTTAGTGGFTASSSSSASTAGSTTASGSTGGAGGAMVQPCTLTDSGPVTASVDGQVIERLRINASGDFAIKVDGFHGVVIRDVEIVHTMGVGIDFANADDLLIQNVSIAYDGGPATGPNPSSDLNNIQGYQSSGVHIDHVRLSRGSTGIYLQACPSSVLQWIEGHDFRGPFPRGQLVQWNTSDNALLEDFSVVNDAGSWTEDNVNVYKSLGATVRRGLVDGNNSPSGVGVIFDGDTSTGLVEDVDAVHMGNGCFSNYAGADGNTFRRTRCRDNICTDQGRGLPSSNALMWAGHPGETAIRLEQSSSFASCNGNLIWPVDSFAVHELTEEDFALRSTVKVAFCWE